ncbi:MAG TPA: hypothetical protein VJT73_03000 [Polyangiaceae bacterium]|nr:hypothetical protein [Polyangiaceae bacterium]
MSTGTASIEHTILRRRRPRSAGVAFLLPLIVSCGGKSSDATAIVLDRGTETPDRREAGAPEVDVVEAGASEVDAIAPPGASIEGRWGMIGFEDPVGVQLFQAGSKITGRGCAEGAPPLAGPDPGHCGDIGGRIEGRRVDFGFTFDLAPPSLYTAHATVSADGTRMAGYFGEGRYPSAWLRLAPNEAWVPTRPYDGPGVSMTVRWAESPVEKAEDEIDHGRAYEVRVPYDGMVFGDLGAFASGEVVRPPKSAAFVAGPVVETDRHLPTRLEASLTGDTTVVLTADMPSGGRYIFRGNAKLYLP